MEETIRRYGHLVTPPGEKHQYCNLGYGVLDHVIARLSGKSYPEFMRQEVFLPLGMTRASVDIGPGLEPYAAARYGSDGLPLPFYTFDHPGGSAIYCSAHDLVRFGMFHLKAHLSDRKAILPDAALDEMQVPTTPGDGRSGYGFGWSVEADHFGYRCVSHGGGMAGVATSLQLFPEEKLVVVALANAGTDLPWVATDEILSVLLPEYGPRLAERKAKEAEEKAKREKEQGSGTGFVPPPELQGEWRGAVHTSQGEIPLVLLVKESGDIHAKLGDQLKTLLNDIEFKEGQLSGRILGDLGTDDTRRRPHHLHAGLKLRGEVLNGVLLAISLPAPRSGFALGHWTELKRQG
jgi:CubicO group peptidase (beta-lactamase class C family)